MQNGQVCCSPQALLMTSCVSTERLGERSLVERSMFERHVRPQVVYLRPFIHEDLEQAADERELLRPRQVIIPLQAACEGVGTA